MRLRKIVAISSAFALVTALGMQGASALVWTDQADYAPGSVVTIHGDNSDGAGYLEGESVAVSVLGPNGYTASCVDDAVVDGAWACDITLWDSMDAVGAYTYTAVGQTSGVVATGDFTDAVESALVTFTITQTGLTSGTLTLPIVMTYKPPAGADVTSTNNVSNTASHTLTVKKNNDVTYSGFSASVVVGSQTCTRNAGQADSGIVDVGTADTGLTVAYTCAATQVADSTPPVISYTLTGTAGDNGWYTSDVIVDWTVTDAESAVVIDSGCVDQTLSSETAGMTLTCTAHSSGGSASDSVGVKIDKTGPSASLAVTAGTAGLNGWYTSDVTLSTSGTDSISGPVACTADQYQTTNTSGTVFNGSCTNNAGLTTNASSVTVKVAKTGPSALLTVTAGTPGANGWYTSNVTVHTSGSDANSSPVTCTVDQHQTAETTGTVFNGSCTNDAGLTTDAAPITIKLDKTAPTAALAVTAGTAGTNGWYTSDVTVATSGSDDMSAVTCTADQDLTTETTGIDFNGSCTNEAGLSTDAAALNVKLDKTGPSANLAVTAGTAGSNGWYTSDVTVSTTGSDSISGPATCTADQQQTDETADQLFYGSCTNDAGLMSNATAIHVKLDKTGPSASLAVTAGTAGSNGWYTSDVTVGASGTDSISSPVACTADQFQTSETTGTEFYGSCTNDAGLTTNAIALTVKLDKTGPSASLSVTSGTLGDNGWYTSDVTVSTTGADDVSGPTSCTADQFQTTETGGTAFNGSCTNDAGLTTNATALNVKLDKTAPTVQWNGGPAAGAVYYFNYVPSAPTCTAVDSLSGAGSCVVSGYSNAIGSHTMTATAYDLAGNQTIVTRSYSVQAWTLRGFYQPVDMGSVWNVVKAGSTVPLKFEVFAGSTELITKDAIVTGPGAGFTVLANPAGGPPPVATDVIPTDALSSGKTQLRYDATSGQFIQNWQTPKSPGYYKVTLKTLDGSTLIAWFLLK